MEPLLTYKNYEWGEIAKESAGRSDWVVAGTTRGFECDVQQNIEEDDVRITDDDNDDDNDDGTCMVIAKHDKNNQET